MDNQVTVLPDGSAFATASWPLPKDHWLYAPHQRTTTVNVGGRSHWCAHCDDCYAEGPLSDTDTEAAQRWNACPRIASPTWTWEAQP